MGAVSGGGKVTLDRRVAAQRMRARDEPGSAAPPNLPRPLPAGRLETVRPEIPRRELGSELAQMAVRRIRLVSAVLAVALTGIWWLVLLVQGNVRDQFSHPAQWVPPVATILASVAVALLTLNPRVPTRTVIAAGLLQLVGTSFGIAFGQYMGVFADVPLEQMRFDRFGVSWVALWMFFFAALVPTQPRLTLAALGGSVGAVPSAVAISRAVDGLPPLPADTFVLLMVFPYLVTAVLGYSMAKVLYGARVAMLRYRRLGSYVLEERLGSGGMGQVWRARHEMLARPAAVKTIRPEMLKPGPVNGVLAGRFAQEARVTSTLQSPHTVALYDFGTGVDGTLYYVMELLRGIDLEKLVQAHGPMPPERVVHVLRQACQSLAEAHGLGLVHRDIKPANIYLCRYAVEYDFVKVLDFGLVKRSAAHDGELSSFSHDRTIVGTPSFMAPEAALGHPVDHRADLYALGCVAYWLLTGQLVFARPTATATLLAHAGEQPIPPSRRTDQPIPESLDQLVLACLAKNPAQRVPTAERLCERLDAVPLDQVWTNQRAARWWERHHPELLLPAPAHLA